MYRRIEVTKTWTITWDTDDEGPDAPSRTPMLGQDVTKADARALIDMLSGDEELIITELPLECSECGEDCTLGDDPSECTTEAHIMHNEDLTLCDVCWAKFNNCGPQ